MSTPIAEIAEMLDRGCTAVKGALNEPGRGGAAGTGGGAGFSRTRAGLYVKVPRVPQVQVSDQLMAGKPAVTEPEKPTV